MLQLKIIEANATEKNEFFFYNFIYVGKKNVYDTYF